MKQHRVIDTCEVLIKAYFKDKLIHGNPCSCAVGNLIQNSGVIAPFDEWYRVLKFPDSVGGWSKYKYDRGMGQLKSVLYSFQEIEKIERAFERVMISSLDKIDNGDGLFAVFDLLQKEVDKDYFDKEEKEVNIFELLNGKEVCVV